MSFKSLSMVAAAALALCAGAAQAQTTNGFANGGFEIDGAPDTPAANWLPAAAGYSRTSAEAHSGAFSALLAGPVVNAAVMLQNSEKDGGLPPLTLGDTPTLTFWAKGSAGDAGNALFALRFLDTTGNIKYDSNLQFFDAKINTTTWTQISFSPSAVPVGATAAFLEFSQAGGGTGNGKVYIDDVYLGVTAVPEPESYAMMLAGLGVVGAIVRRRRQA